MSIIYKRPVVSFCIMMIAGILAAFLSGSVFVILSIFFLMAVCFYVCCWKRGSGSIVSAGMLAFFMLGAMDFLIVDKIQLESFEKFDGREVAVKGYIVSDPEIRGEKVTYIVKATGIREGYDADFAKVGGKVLMSTLMQSSGSEEDTSELLDYGRDIVFEGTLTQPGGVRNPGGFDYRRYLAQKGVGASVFAYPYAVETGGVRGGNFLVRAGMSARDGIVGVISKSLPRQQAGLLNGMLIGYRKGLADEVREAFSNAGLTHIMAVSGANIAFLILPLSFLLKLIGIRRKAANLIIICFLFMFVFITGFEPSVLRAALMAAILLLSAILYREPDIYAAIALSCIILLAVSPCMLFNVGFQLSYAATLGIVMLYRNIKKLITCSFLPGKAAELIAATLAAQLGVLPVTLVHFNRVSVISIIPNILAAPMLELITILGMLMAVLGQFSLVLSRSIGYLNSVFLSAVLYITKWASDVPFASVNTATPSMLLAAAYYATVWFLLWFKPLKGITLKAKYYAMALTVAALAITAGSLWPGRLDVVFLDVGQGDSAFIRTYSGKTVLIDGGGSSNPSLASEVGEKTVIPFLLDSGAGSLDIVVATHPHSDHIQGLCDVIGNMKVGKLIIPSLEDESGFSGLLAAAEAKRTTVYRCAQGDIIRLDNRTYMRVLSPERNCPVDDEALNNTSVILKLCYGNTSILFTGDAETEIEERLIANASNLEADVLKVAHHGSQTSSGRDFLSAVDPEAAVISVGRNNFGHPSDEVLELLKENNIEYFRTDECGAVILQSDGNKIKINRTVKEER